MLACLISSFVQSVSVTSSTARRTSNWLETLQAGIPVRDDIPVMPEDGLSPEAKSLDVCRCDRIRTKFKVVVPARYASTACRRSPARSGGVPRVARVAERGVLSGVDEVLLRPITRR